MQVADALAAVTAAGNGLKKTIIAMEKRIMGLEKVVKTGRKNADNFASKADPALSKLRLDEMLDTLALKITQVLDARYEKLVEKTAAHDVIIHKKPDNIATELKALKALYLKYPHILLMHWMLMRDARQA
jgi:ethanolamine utilization protein EutA (predicted chaperonin)